MTIRARNAPSARDWLSDGVVITEHIGTTKTTAIVHPQKFTSAAMNAALARLAALDPSLLQAR
jgi:hypothetical protein